MQGFDFLAIGLAIFSYCGPYRARRTVRRSLCCSAPHTSSPSSALTPPPSFTRLRFSLSGCVPPLTGSPPQLARRAPSLATYALTWLLPAIGLGETSVIVAVVAVLGAIVTFTTLPEPKGQSLESIAETPRVPSSAAALGIAESRAGRPPAA